MAIYTGWSEPDWDRDWLYVEFDPRGDACAMQDHYAATAEEMDHQAYCEDFDLARDEFGENSEELFFFLLCREDEPFDHWRYRDAVFLGPYEA